MDLTRRSFVVENDWYWRISENERTLDADAAVRDFLRPLSRLAKEVVTIDDIVAGADGVIRFTFGAAAGAGASDPVAIEIVRGSNDRAAIGQLVGDLNRLLAPVHHAFALVVPRRYELRGVLVTDEQLAALAGNPVLLIPSGRPSRGAIPVQTSGA